MLLMAELFTLDAMYGGLEIPLRVSRIHGERERERLQRGKVKVERPRLLIGIQ